MGWIDCRGNKYFKVVIVRPWSPQAGKLDRTIQDLLENQNLDSPIESGNDHTISFHAFTKKFIGKLTRFKNLPSPLPKRVSAKGRNDFAKEGLETSLWQREDWRDFPVNIFILLNSIIIAGLIDRCKRSSAVIPARPESFPGKIPDALRLRE